MTAWRLLKSGEHKELLSRIYKFVIPKSGDGSPIEYSNWRNKWVELSEENRKEIVKQIEVLSQRPSFTLILDANGWDAVSLFATIGSVAEQLYPNWVLHISNINELDAELSEKIQTLNDIRIKNSVVTSSDLTDWVVELTPDTQLHETALFAIAVSINKKPEVVVLYSDHDHIDPGGNFCDPYMKPDWNPDLFAEMNYLKPFVAFKKELWFTYREEESNQPPSLVQITEALSRNEIFHIPHVLATVRVSDKGVHLQPTHKRVIHALPNPAPTVSILIPTKDKGRMLDRCLRSLREKTDYSDLEIVIVDHESTEKYAKKIIAKAAENPNTKVIEHSGIFNFSAMINRAARSASGKVLLLLNNDTEVVNSNWLKEMVSQVSRPEVGVVGALLTFNDGTIQHAGVNPSSEGFMIHSHKHWESDSSGYFGRLRVVHEVAAVTGACLAIEAKDWEALEGLDEENLGVAYNDIDLCLKARSAGLKIIFTPHAKLIHQESVTRGFDNTPQKIERLSTELSVMKSRWGQQLDEDPAYNPNLSNEKISFEFLSDPPRTKPLWDL